MSEQEIAISSNLKNAFELFFNSDHYRPVMNSPFTNNGKVCATNGYALIFCDKNDCDFEVNNVFQQDAPNIDSIIPTPNVSIPLNIKQSEFEELRTVDETETEGEDVECSTCDGEGEVEWSFKRWTEDFDCPACCGSGVKEFKKSIKTGRKIFKENDLVKLGDVYFKMNLFYKLLQVQQIMGEEILQIYNGKNNGRLFKVGTCHVLIMKWMHNGMDDEVNILEVLAK